MDNTSSHKGKAFELCEHAYGKTDVWPLNEAEILV